MFKVNNAIILAAGRGSRLKNLTNDIPKPLLSVNKNPLIEDIIINLKEANIKKIIIVVGYLHEQFMYLKTKYSNIEILVNHNWNNGNNITSIIAAKKYLANSLIVNGDIIIKKNIFKDHYPYSLSYVEYNENIDEWIVNINKENNILGFDKNGLNKKGFYQREILFIDGKLAKVAKQNFSIISKDEYQEFLFLNVSLKNKIKFGIYEIPRNTVFDLDTKNEFLNYKNS